MWEQILDENGFLTMIKRSTLSGQDNSLTKYQNESQVAAKTDIKPTYVPDIVTLGSLVRGNVTSVHVQDINRGGLFVWNATGYTADGGCVIAANDGGVWVRQFSGPINAKWFNVIGGGSIDNYTALTAAMAATPVGGVLFLPAGVYKTSKLTINRSDLSIIGEPGTVLTTTGRQVIELGDVSRIRFEDITFASSMNSTVPDYYGLVFSNNKTLSNITFQNCGFTAQSCVTNGLKFIVDQLGTSLTFIKVETCNFYSIGRMGLEVQSHLNDGVSRYSDITVIRNSFVNLGLVAASNGDHYGMGVSFSGQGQNIRVIDNIIDNPYDIGLELAGSIDYSIVAGNRFRNILRSNSEASRATCLISYQTGFKVVLENNITEDISAVTANVYLRQLTYSRISGNKFRMSNFFQMVDCTDILLENNIITTSDIYGILLDRSGRNVFENNTVIGAKPSGMYSTIRCDGVNASNNIFKAGTITNTDGTPFSEINSATGNRFEFALINNVRTTTPTPYADLSGKPTGLDAFTNTPGYIAGSNNLSDLGSASTARTNLGLGTIATQSAGNVGITGGTISGVAFGGTNTHVNVYPLADGSGNVGGTGKAWNNVTSTSISSEKVSERYAGSGIYWYLSNGTKVGGILPTSGGMINKPVVSAVNPTTSDIASGFGIWWKNSVSGKTQYWYNDAGTLISSLALNSSNN